MTVQKRHSSVFDPAAFFVDMQSWLLRIDISIQNKKAACEGGSEKKEERQRQGRGGEDEMIFVFAERSSCDTFL